MSATWPPNWYPDPQNPAMVRWWDGQRWTEHAQPRTLQQPDASVAMPSPVHLPIPGNDAVTQGIGNAQAAVPRKVGLFGAKAAARDLAAENERLRSTLSELDGLRLAEVRALTVAADHDLARALRELSAVRNEVNELQARALDIRHAIDVQEFGLYDFEHPAEASARLSADLSSVRLEIRNCMIAKRATSAAPNFMFNNSAAKGRSFIDQMSKMMLAAYNAEAENAIKTVKAGGLGTAQARMEKAAERVARNGQMIALRITPEYHRLRMLELELAARHLAAVQAERELERAHREELRDAKRAEEELRREREKLDKEREHYVTALAALEARGDEAGAAELRARLEQIDRSIADVDYRAANVRAGYVYVISNVGSLGDRVVKIGMTRRLDPMDRVRELSDASVPFNFDVHALFFSEDAYGIEAMLHRHFANKRVNRMNFRREFFYATPGEVLDALREHKIAVVEYRTEVPAEEYRASQALAAAGAPRG